MSLQRPSRSLASCLIAVIAICTLVGTALLIASMLAWLFRAAATRGW